MFTISRAQLHGSSGLDWAHLDVCRQLVVGMLWAAWSRAVLIWTACPCSTWSYAKQLARRGCVCWQSNGSRQTDWLRDWAWQNQSSRRTGAGPVQKLPFAKHLPGSRHGVKDSVPVPFFILVVSISSWANGSSSYVKWLYWLVFVSLMQIRTIWEEGTSIKNTSIRFSCSQICGV